MTLLILPGASLMCVAAALDPLRAANRVSGWACYRWTLTSTTGEVPHASCGLPIAVAGAYAPAAATDMLLVIGGFGVIEQATRPLLLDLRQAARAGVMIGGIEAGAWALARAGLLDGRRATTHWEDLEDFRLRFPDVDVRPDRFVIDGPVFTTGGAAPAFDLMLHLIRARQGETVALDVAGIFIYEGSSDGSDRQRYVSLDTLQQHDPRVTKAIRVMEDHLGAPLSTRAVARHVGCSTRSLEGSFRRSIAMPPGAYYLGLRLNAARRLIVDHHLSVADAAERTGFSSTSTLSRAFRRRFGHPPREAKRKL